MKPILIYQSNNIYKKILYSVGSSKPALKFGQQINKSEGRTLLFKRKILIDIIEPNVEKKLHNWRGVGSIQNFFGTKLLFKRNKNIIL